MPDFRNSLMNLYKKFSPYAQWLVVLLAMLLPFLIIRSFPKFFHGSDVDDFWRWSQGWAAGWQSVYINCERCNYPFLGTLLSGGVMSWIDIENFLHLASRFRYYLALVDALNILVIWFILMKMRVRNAPLWAGLIGLLPSSWLGSSVWGQIDGIGQLLILAFFILLIWFNSKERSEKQYYLFLMLAGLLLSFMLLTKQLIYFSLFALGLVLLANIVLYSRTIGKAGLSVLVAAMSIILPVLVLDLNLDLKDPYFSHLQYVLATGSKHGDTISSVGFNIWVFFVKDLLGSSHAAIPIQVGSMTLFSIVPYSLGIILFLLVNAFLFYYFAKHIWQQRSQNVRAFPADTILLFFLYLALVNLSFNLTLTGTHERYLYHFYPFVVIACLGLKDRSPYFNRVMLAVLIVGALIYGAFLYAYLTLLVRTYSVFVLRALGAFHLFLFGYLIYSMRMFFKSHAFDDSVTS